MIVSFAGGETGQTIQRSKRRTMIYKTLHRKTKDLATRTPQSTIDGNLVV